MMPVSSPVRAVICDVYGTLLRVGPPPPDAQERWISGCGALTGAGRVMTLAEFNERCARAVALQHAERRAGGESFPEVDWMAVVGEAWGRSAGAEDVAELSRLHALCSRTCSAMPGAIAALKSLHAAGVPSGLASNAQHYTRDELVQSGFPLSLFHGPWCFLSGDHGFAKPSPRVFAHLTEKLAADGIAPHEIVMVGDHAENDIIPAAAAGWQTWHLRDEAATVGGTGWSRLAEEVLRCKAASSGDSLRHSVAREAGSPDFGKGSDLTAS